MVIDKRITQLDSIRGLASLSVFFSHIWPLFPGPFTSYLYVNTPVRMAVYGHGAVMLFFVLSGFVLTLPFLGHLKVSYKQFLIKRFFRIYIPYLAAIVVAMIAFRSSDPIQGLGAWISELSTGKFSMKSIVDHLLLVGNYDTKRYDTVIWTLVQELRISLVFPILALLIVRAKWQLSLIVCLLLSSITSLNQLLEWEPVYGFKNSFSQTSHYCAIFIVGGLIAKHRLAFIHFYGRLPRRVKYASLALAMALYTYGIKMQGAAIRMKLPFVGEVAQDYTIVAGIVSFLMIALGSKKMSSLLSLKITRFFGDISYSLYLWHIIVLIGAIHLLHGVLPLVIIVLLVFCVTVAISWLSYRYIELPAIKMGKRMTSGRKAKQRQQMHPEFKM
ncbi:acyltransferase family protein [Cohnella sp. GCM10020058]|uniref:acyltransferase family protein n=1 Tax=Cohnella sp. GCM10020058 TaxID=3317330 RepID=UPI003625BEE3